MELFLVVLSSLDASTEAQRVAAAGIGKRILQNVGILNVEQSLPVAAKCHRPNNVDLRNAVIVGRRVHAEIGIPNRFRLLEERPLPMIADLKFIEQRGTEDVGVSQSGVHESTRIENWPAGRGGTTQIGADESGVLIAVRQEEPVRKPAPGRR